MYICTFWTVQNRFFLKANPLKLSPLSIQSAHSCNNFPLFENKFSMKSVIPLSSCDNPKPELIKNKVCYGTDDFFTLLGQGGFTHTILLSSTCLEAMESSVHLFGMPSVVTAENPETGQGSSCSCLTKRKRLSYTSNMLSAHLEDILRVHVQDVGNCNWCW